MSEKSFTEVVDWCERHLEGQVGREAAMTFASLLRAYDRLAGMPTVPDDLAGIHVGIAGIMRTDRLLWFLSRHLSRALVREQAPWEGPFERSYEDARAVFDAETARIRARMWEPSNMVVNHTYDPQGGPYYGWDGEKVRERKGGGGKETGGDKRNNG
jgi:hypothetical protein